MEEESVEVVDTHPITEATELHGERPGKRASLPGSEIERLFEERARHQVEGARAM